jgi:hypothetical protein
LYVQGLGESLLSVLIGVKGDTYDNYKQPRVGGIEAILAETPPVEPPPVEFPPVALPPVEAAPVPEAPSLALIGASLPVLAWLGKRYYKIDQR